MANKSGIEPKILTDQEMIAEARKQLEFYRLTDWVGITNVITLLELLSDRLESKILPSDEK